MGHNLDLYMMLGAPKEVECKSCGSKFFSYYDDYDIEEGANPNPEPGIWKLRAMCDKSDKIIYHEFRVTAAVE